MGKICRYASYVYVLYDYLKTLWKLLYNYDYIL